jgi:HK97 family phage major capsid protein
MTISAKIVAAKAAIAEKKNELAIIAEKAANGEDVDASVLETLTKSIEDDQAKVVALEKAEGVLMSKSSAPAFIKNKSANEYSIAKSVIVSMVAKNEGISQVAAAAKVYGEDSGTFAVTKAAASAANGAGGIGNDGVAITADNDWAAQLLRPAYGQFLDILRPQTILPRLAAAGGQTLNFDTNGSLILPTYAGTKGQVSGSFLGEGGSIQVKATKFGQKSIKQAKLGVITVFSKEILSRSIPAIEPIVQDAIVQDTAYILDTAAISTSTENAATNTPAGLLAGATAVPVGGSADHAAVTKAFRTAFNKMNDENLGQSPVIVISPQTARAISLMTNTNGAYIFRDEIAAGRFLGAPLILSTAVPLTQAIVVDTAHMAFGLGAPAFTTSDSAALIMDDTGKTTNTATNGAIYDNQMTSLFQTDSMAVRMIARTAWSALRDGAVQYVTGLSAI